MIDSLSILLPCYNNTCLDLVADLLAQAEGIIRAGKELRYEIIVADDGSTDTAVINKNRQIDALPNARYIVRGHNSGRAAIRNYLAREARYPTLLFIDSDMAVCSPTYLNRYLRLDSDGVTYGGYTVRGGKSTYGHNLQYLYEKAFSLNNTAEKRNTDPYRHFRTHNFTVSRHIMLAHPFDERIRKYGYEDVIWGKTLKDNGIMITHIDNPVSINTFETNARFIAKTEEGIATLAMLSDDLRGYSALISAADSLGRLRLTRPAALLFKTFSKAMKNNLTGNNPRLLLLNIYKLGMFCSLKSR